VAGRKTGRLYSTPVDVIEVAGDRWLVAGYAPVGWMRNARAAGEVTLSRGGRSEKFRVDEAAAQTAIPVLRAYIGEIKVTRAYFDANPGSPDDATAAGAQAARRVRLTPEVVQANER
jgi:hypothetical protein